MRRIFKILSSIYSALITRLEFMLNNEYTIASYFRKQGAQIGNNCRIYIDTFGSEPYLVKIGNHCTITNGVKFITHDGGCWIFREEIPDLNKFGKIEIEDNCFIGLDSIIMPNVKIGRNSIIGAGAVVTKDVPPESIAIGIPARVIGSTKAFKEKAVKDWEMFNFPNDPSKWKKHLIQRFWGDSYNAK